MQKGREGGGRQVWLVQKRRGREIWQVRGKYIGGGEGNIAGEKEERQYNNER